MNVMEARQKVEDKFLNTPGVVGVGIGYFSKYKYIGRGINLDGLNRCVKVFTNNITPEMKQLIPKSLGGVLIEVEEIGEISAFSSIDFKT